MLRTPRENNEQKLDTIITRKRITMEPLVKAVRQRSLKKCSVLMLAALVMFGVSLLVMAGGSLVISATTTMSSNGIVAVGDLIKIVTAGMLVALGLMLAALYYGTGQREAIEVD